MNKSGRFLTNIWVVNMLRWAITPVALLSNLKLSHSKDKVTNDRTHSCHVCQHVSIIVHKSLT